MANIDQRIDKWKKRLLDLGKRNRLINYRETKRSNIRIISPEIGNLYSRLVLKEELLGFPYSIEEDFENSSEIELNTTVKGDLLTDRNIREQQKTLRNLRSKAKTAIEEQGVNILYVAFGFLQWYESTASSQLITSPVVLVPVNLILKSIADPFMLGLHDDEIVVNPTLLFKLENDFGLSIPEFEGEDNHIVKYLDQIKSIVNKNKWDVTFDVGLSLFSFLKINMYNDLEKNKNKIVANPIIKAIAGDKSSVQSLPEEYNNFDHDKNTKPIDTFQVVDADSSQQDAILFSKKGISFVLQGPPGTGKSQTITNIIAEGLADGKKILFVSEKMAALEVVLKRISLAGLDDFCLTLHSHRANKKEIIKELGKTLYLDKFAIQGTALNQLEALRRDREKLNQYNLELHSPCPPLGKSIFEINGRLAKLFAAPDFIFSIDNVSNTSPEKLDSYTFALNDFSKTIGKMTTDFSENPWRSCHVQNVTHELRHDIETNLQSLVPTFRFLADMAYTTLHELDLDIELSLKNIPLLIEVLNIVSKSPIVPYEWTFKMNISHLLEDAEKYSLLKKEYDSLQQELSQKHNDNFFKIEAGKVINNFSSSVESAKGIL